MYSKHSYCSYCGYKFSKQPWPKTCSHCKNQSFINPIPVASIVVPVNGGFLTVRRGEAPGRGELAFPGGYLDVGETWQEGSVRELREETGVIADAKSVKLITVETSLKHNTTLIFCRIPEINMKSLESFKPNNEVMELVIVSEPIELAFPTHTKILKDLITNA